MKEMVKVGMRASGTAQFGGKSYHVTGTVTQVQPGYVVIMTEMYEYRCARNTVMVLAGKL